MEQISNKEHLIGLIDHAMLIDEKKSMEPLKPKIYEDDSNASKEDENSSKKNELLTRLFYTSNDLKKYNKTIDSDWCLDPWPFNTKDNLTSKSVQLPNHVEENILGIEASANEFIHKLQDQLTDLDRADQRVEENTMKTLSDIDTTYQDFMDKICREINKKRECLRLETEIYKNEALVPLKACRQEVEAQINSTRRLLDLTGIMLKYPHTFNRERFGKIMTASNHLGRIPAVPNPEELPYVNFNHPQNLIKDEITKKISELGSIVRIGSAQIIHIEERPAGLYATWHIGDSECIGEEHTFIVQKAKGEISDNDSSKFETVYEGKDTSCFIRDLSLNELVTLKFKVLTTDTVWSIYKTASTTIPSYSWNVENKNYMVTNEGRIITKITNDTSTIFSSHSQFDVNHVIEFKFLEVSPDGKDDEGIALVFDPQGEEDTLKRNQALLITSRGKIFMDGEEKLMKLPRIRFGAKIIFTAVRKDSDTLRINIECSEKCVTYDWIVQTPLFFAARFKEQNKWNLLVK